MNSVLNSSYTSLCSWIHHSGNPLVKQRKTWCDRCWQWTTPKESQSKKC